ncbi:MAG: GAF domain-containing sensor histidine kinase [Desulfohalobiaceae bacterium]
MQHRGIQQAKDIAQEQLQCIRSITAVLASADMELQDKMGKSLELLLPRIKAGQGSIMLQERSEPGLFRIAASTRHDLVGKSFRLAQGSVAEYVQHSKQSLLVQDINQDPRFTPRNKNYSTDSFLAVPLLSFPGQELLGIINASDRLDLQHFRASDLELFQDFASWLSPWVQNSLILEELRQERDKYQSISRELELKQKELMLKSQERSELVQMVIHDFKSPLSAIISNMDLLQYMGLQDKEHGIVDTARKGAENLLSMIDEFLQMARLDAWQEQGQSLENIRVQEVLDQILKEHSGSLHERQIQVQNELDPALTVIADKALLRHLLQNLLSNAIKYNHLQGSIRISSKLHAARRSLDPYPCVATICIQDSGIGVPEDIKPAIFNKFSRREGSELETKIPGSGIGLFICNRIVTILQGDIWVEDAQPQGSRFCFTLFSTQEQPEYG